MTLKKKETRKSIPVKSRREEIIEIRGEINEIETKNTKNQ